MANAFNTRVAASVGAIAPTLPAAPGSDVRALAKWAADTTRTTNDAFDQLYRYAALMGGDTVESDATITWTGEHTFEARAVIQAWIDFKEITVPATPAANHARLYAKDKSGVSTLYYKRDDGSEIELLPGAGTGFVGGSGVATRVAYWDTTSTLASDASLFLDPVNNRLGINTSLPAASLHIIAATEQARIAYDTVNYLSVTVNDDGLVTLDAIGDSSQHAIRTLDDPFGINRTPTLAWLEIGNEEPAPEMTVTSYIWYSADYMTSGGSPASPYVNDFDLRGTTWYDRSGNSRTLTFDLATAVKFKTSVQNSMPGVNFLPTTFGTIAGATHTLSSYTIYVVCAKPAGTAPVPLFERSTSASYARHPGDPSTASDYRNEGWRVRYATGDGGYFPRIDNAWTLTSYNIFSMTRSGSTHTTYLNGTLIGSTTTDENGFSLSANDLTFDNFRDSTANSVEVTHCEIILFNSALGSGDRAIVENYLNTKYNLNGGGTGGGALDYLRGYNASDDVLVRIDSTGQLALTDTDSDADTLTSRLTLRDAGGDMLDMQTTGTFTTHWELTAPTAARTITVPDDTGTLLLTSNIGTTVQAWDVDLDQIAAVANVRGDLLLTNSGPTWVRLPIGTSGTVLRSDGTDAAWVSLTTAGIVPTTRTLTAGAGLTGGGDLSADRTFDVGAGLGITVNANDVAITLGAANRVLGINAAATNVEYKDILGVANEISVTHAANSITLAFADHPILATKGGTGFASFAVGDLLYADTTSTLAKLPDVATGSVLRSGGVGVAPSWGSLAAAGIVAGAGTGTYVPRWSGTGPSSVLEDSVTILSNDNGVIIGALNGAAAQIFSWYTASSTNYGKIRLTGGDSTGISGVNRGGSIVLTGGGGNPSGGSNDHGGNLDLLGGHAGDVGNGGTLTHVGGVGGSTSGDGGDVIVGGGDAVGGDCDGGDVALSGGLPSGGGKFGFVTIRAASIYAATLTTELLGGPQTFAFPDKSGTFGILEANNTWTDNNIFYGKIGSSLILQIGRDGGFDPDASNVTVGLGNASNFGTFGVTFGAAADLQSWWGATPVGRDTGWSASNYTPTKTLDPTIFVLPEVSALADVVCTLIDVLKTYGKLG